MKKKKIVNVLCIVLVTAMFLSACGGTSSETSSNPVMVSSVNEFPITEEPTTLKVFVAKPSDVEDLETNTFTKWYEEKTNVKIDWKFVTGDVRQSINLQIASNDYADVFLGFGFSRSEQVAYHNQGIFIDMSDLYEKHGYYIKKMFEDDPRIETAARHTDNKLLGIPNILDDFSNAATYKMWVYEPWMKKLGAKNPETTEEFYELLKRFKEEDPNGNGIADEVPLAGRNTTGYEQSVVTYLMSSFVPWGTFGFYNDNGKAAYSPIQDGAREGIRYMKKLYEEGLLHTDSFTMDRNRITALAEAETPILGAAPSKWTTQFAIGGSDSGRVNEYIAIPPLEGPDGVRFSQLGLTDPGCSFFSITSACKNPEVAFKWIDWFYSEEQYIKNRGPAGIRKASEGELGFDGEQALYTIENTTGVTDLTLQNERWSFTAPCYWPLERSIKTLDNSLDSIRQKNAYKAYELYKPYLAENVVYADITVAPDEGEEYMELRTNLRSAAESGVISFIIGENDIDTDWDEYVDDFYRLGLERYLELVQKDIDSKK